MKTITLILMSWLSLLAQYTPPSGGGGSAGGGGVTYCDATSSPAGVTYGCTPGTALAAYAAGATLAFVPDVTASGGATTVNVSALGAKSIKEADGSTNPSSVDLIAGQTYVLTYDGTNFRLAPSAPLGAPLYANSTCTTAATINPANGSFQSVLLTAANACAITFTLPSAGQMLIRLRITQAATPTATATWAASVKWPGGIAPVITASASARDWVSCNLDSAEADCTIGQAFQ